MAEIKKILWIVGYSPNKIGSFERLMIGFSEECNKRNVAFKIVFPNEPCEQFKIEIFNNDAEIDILTFANRIDPIYIIKLSMLIKKFNPDILHSHFDFANFTSIWTQLMYPVPYYIWHQHNFAGSRLPLLRRMIFKAVSKKAKCIMAISKSVKNDIANKGIDEKIIHVVYNGIDLNLYNIRDDNQMWQDIRHKYGFGKDDVVIGSVSEAREEKGLQYLIEAFSLIKRSDLKLLLIGAKQGPFARYIEKRIEELDIVKNIVCTKFIDNVHQVLSAVDIVVVPSFMEGLSYGALEALACGKPVVASETGGLKEIIENNKNGLFAEPKNPKSIASAIQKLIQDKKIYNSMKQHARLSVQYKFNLEKNIDQIFKLYGIN
ncbi:MAG: glycosyltransferase family 4 protein [bacterium]|nr:glycosyltransferase family 4 protein [bacterium]